MAGDKMLMGLDIGSSKIRCVIGSVNHDGQLMVDSICERPSEGVRNGSIVNIELTLKAISSVVNEAELQAGAELSEVIIGIGGENIVCVPSNGVAGIKGNGQEIKQEDVMSPVPSSFPLTGRSSTRWSRSSTSTARAESRTRSTCSATAWRPRL